MADCPPDAPCAKDDMVKKFLEMVTGFKSNTDSAMSEVAKGFGDNLNAALKNYGDFQKTYFGGFTEIATGSKKANNELLQSMDKNYNEFKKQLANLYTETVTKTDGALATGSNEFKKQCEEVVKKYPMLPEKVYKDVISSITDSKRKLTSEMEKRYKDVVDKLDTNFQTMKKDLTLPDFKMPTLPALDLGASVANTSNLMAVAVSAIPSALKNLASQMPGSSKK